jgi:hypothetical protein
MRRSRKANESQSPGAATAREGILYSSSGQSYIAEAVRSARSSLQHNAIPHLLFASADAEPCAGLTVERFEPSENPFADKIASMRRSPFERTIYLDSDTFVAGEIAHLLALLDNYDIAVAYAPAHRGRADPEVPSAFYEFNTGVIAWRASERMASFMDAWESTYRAWQIEDPFPVRRSGSRGGRADQLAFRRCAWQHDVRLFVLAPEYNFRLGYPQTVVDSVRVIHGRHPDYESLAASLNDELRPRSWPPPPGPWESATFGLRKAAHNVKRRAGSARS